jgi:autotransporter-associated beta strand protein
VRLSANEQITATGTVTVNVGGVLDLSGFTETIGNLSLHGGAVAMGAGTLVVTGDVTQAASAASSIAGRLDLGGATRTILAGDVPVTAVDLDISAEVINGSFIKQGAGALRLGGNNAFAGGVNHKFGKLLIGHDNALGTGTLSLDGGAIEADGGARSISNSIVVASLSTVSGPDALTFNGSFATNLGAALTKSGTGALSIAGPQAHASGAALFATAGVINFDSSAPGATLNVNLSNAGTLVNFNADQNLNTLVVNGGRARVGDATLLGANSLSVAAGAELELELGGLIAGSEHAKLVMSNHASLAGTLEITLTGGFMPQAGDVFDVLDWGSRSGSFSAMNLPRLDGSATWDASSLYTTGVLSVLPAYEADFDLDGDVDGDDLTQWEGDFGVNDLSDADGDGDSDGADFLAWQQQLGSVPTVAAASAVPEPRAILLLTMATAGLLGRWRPCPEGERPGFLAAR